MNEQGTSHTAGQASAPLTLDTMREHVLALYRDDIAVQAAKIEIGEITADSLTLTQTVRPEMVNGLGVLHGGHTFFLADTAFAHRMAMTGTGYFTRSAEIIFVAAVRAGATISATAVVRTVFGRSAICDVTVRDDTGAVVAEVRVNGVAARG